MCWAPGAPRRDAAGGSACEELRVEFRLGSARAQRLRVQLLSVQMRFCSGGVMRTNWQVLLLWDCEACVWSVGRIYLEERENGEAASCPTAAKA